MKQNIYLLAFHKPYLNENHLPIDQQKKCITQNATEKGRLRIQRHEKKKVVQPCHLSLENPDERPEFHCELFVLWLNQSLDIETFLPNFLCSCLAMQLRFLAWDIFLHSFDNKEVQKRKRKHVNLRMENDFVLLVWNGQEIDRDDEGNQKLQTVKRWRTHTTWTT